MYAKEKKETTQRVPSEKKAQVWSNLSSGATSNGTKPSTNKKSKRPSSSARRADLSSTKGMHKETKEKVAKMVEENNR